MNATARSVLVRVARILNRDPSRGDPTERPIRRIAGPAWTEIGRCGGRRSDGRVHPRRQRSWHRAVELRSGGRTVVQPTPLPRPSPPSDRMRHRLVSVVMLLAVPGWLYLWLGSHIDAARVVVFVVGYLLLGVALTGQRAARETSPRRPSMRRPSA